MDDILRLFRNFPEFESKRLRFRDIDESDLQALYEIYSNANTLKYQVISPFKSFVEMKRYIDIIREGYENRYFIRWGLEEKATGKLIGLISLQHLEFWNYKAEVGYILNESYWNKGFITEAVGALIRKSLYEWKFHRIEAAIHPGNIGSIRVVEKLGFYKESYKKEVAFDRVAQVYQDRVIYVTLSKKGIHK